MLTAGAAALVLAAVHLVARRFEEALSVVPRSRWLSVGGGISVAYVFVHLLPEVAAYQAELDRAGGIADRLDDELWYGALIGLTVMYGLERLAVARRRHAPTDTAALDLSGWVHLVSYALYNALAGYLLLEEAERDDTTLLLYTVAIGLHFLVNDRSLAEHHGVVYRTWGRWVVAAAVLLGWLVSIVGAVGPRAVAILIGVLAGGIVLNVLKEELPTERRSRFSVFATAASGYAALLALV